MAHHRRMSDVSDTEEEGILRVDPTTREGRRIQMLKLTGLPLLPILALFIYIIVQLSSEVSHLNKLTEFRKLVNRIELLMDGVVVHLLNEATAVGVYVGTNGTDLIGLWYALKDSTDASSTLSALYSKTDQALEHFPWPEDGIAHYKAKSNFQASLANHRSGLKPGNLGKEYVMREILYYETVLGTLNDWKVSVFHDSGMSVDILTPLVAYFRIMKTSSAVFFERMLGTLYYVLGGLPNDLHVVFIHYHELSLALLREAEVYYPQFNQHYEKGSEGREEVAYLYQEMAPLIYNNLPTKVDLYVGISWDQRTSDYFETLENVRHIIRDITLSKLATDINSTVTSLTYYAIVSIVLLIGFLPYLFFNSTQTTQSLRIYSYIMAKNNLELRREKRKAERLLNQMLPRSVAERLRRGHDVQAESFGAVTVYFSDIPDFPEISKMSSPMEIVTFLNEVYKFMDTQIERYDVYKVETIGCVYMVVSGLPSRNGDRHSIEIARMSLDIMENMEDFIIPHIKDRNVKLRVGLSSGPCVAGVVGLRSPRYCLFGDTVNTAARMQTNGITSKIHVTRQTRDLLMKQGGFKLESRGVVNIKGKGSMETYWLLERLSKTDIKQGENASDTFSDTF